MSPDASDTAIAQRVKEAVEVAFALVMFLGLTVGIPVWVIASNWGEPLYAARTVTVTETQHYGLLVDAAAPLLVWGLVMLLVWGVATGRIPSMRRL